MHLTLHTEPFIYQEKVSISITGPIQTLNIELEVNALKNCRDLERGIPDQYYMKSCAAGIERCLQAYNL